MLSNRFILVVFTSCILAIVASCGSTNDKGGFQATGEDVAADTDADTKHASVSSTSWRMYGNNGSNQRHGFESGPHGTGVVGLWYSDPIYTTFECTPVFDSLGTCYLEDLHGDVYTIDVSAGMGSPQLYADVNTPYESFSSCAISEYGEDTLFWPADGYLYKKPLNTLNHSSHFIDGSILQLSSPVCPGNQTDLVVVAGSLYPGTGDYLSAFVKASMSHLPSSPIPMPGPSMSTPCCLSVGTQPIGQGPYYPSAWMICENSGIHSVNCWDLNTGNEPFGSVQFTETPVDRCSVVSGRCYNWFATNERLYAVETGINTMFFIDWYQAGANETITSNLAYTSEEFTNSSEVIFVQMEQTGLGCLAGFDSHYLSQGPLWVSDPYQFVSETPPAIDVDNYVYVTAGDTFMVFNPFDFGNPTTPVISLTYSEGHLMPPSINDGKAYAVYEDPRGFSRLFAWGDGAGMPWPPPPPDKSNAWPQEGKVLSKERRASNIVAGMYTPTLPQNIQNTDFKVADPTISCSGDIYISLGNGELIKFNDQPAPGSIEWTFTPPMLGDGYATPAMSLMEEAVYHSYWNLEGGRGNCWLSAHAVADGAELWRTRIGHDAYPCSPVVGDDGNIYIGSVELPPSGPCECYVLVVSPAGQILAKSSVIEAESVSTCTIDGVGDIYAEYMLYTQQTMIVKYRYSSGNPILLRLADSIPVSDAGPYVHAPVLVNEEILINGNTDNVIVHDTGTLGVVYTRPTAITYPQDSAPAVSDTGLVYFAEYTAQYPPQISLVCYNAFTGTDVWVSNPVAGYSFNKPLVLPAFMGDIVIISTTDDVYQVATSMVPQTPVSMMMPGDYGMSSPVYGMVAGAQSLVAVDNYGYLHIIPFI